MYDIPESDTVVRGGVVDPDILMMMCRKDVEDDVRYDEQERFAPS